MSHTDHYMDLTAQQIISMLDKLGRHPRIVKECDGQVDLLLWDPHPSDRFKNENDLPWGVDITITEQRNGWLKVDKGFTVCWNGQSILAELIEEHLGHPVDYVD